MTSPAIVQISLYQQSVCVCVCVNVILDGTLKALFVYSYKLCMCLCYHIVVCLTMSCWQLFCFSVESTKCESLMLLHEQKLFSFSVDLMSQTKLDTVEVVSYAIFYLLTRTCSTQISLGVVFSHSGANVFILSKTGLRNWSLVGNKRWLLLGGSKWLQLQSGSHDLVSPER